MQQKNELENVTLPFRINEGINPEIVPYNKVPKKKLLSGWNSGSPAWYDDESKKVYLLIEKPSRFVITHEIAHAQIPNVKVGESDDSKAKAMLEDEIKAFLLTYKRIGVPKSFYDKFNSLQHELSAVYTSQDNPWKYNFCEIMLKERDVYDKVIKKYWSYLPEQWKVDWKRFREVTWPEVHIRRRINYPPADFAVAIDNSGKQGIAMVPRRVEKVKNEKGKEGYKVSDSTKELLGDVRYTLGKNWGILRAINFDKDYSKIKNKRHKNKRLVTVARFRAVG